MRGGCFDGTISAHVHFLHTVTYYMMLHQDNVLWETIDPACQFITHFARSTIYARRLIEI
jgi:hypothetical protein